MIFNKNNDNLFLVENFPYVSLGLNLKKSGNRHILWFHHS